MDWYIILEVLFRGFQDKNRHQIQIDNTTVDITIILLSFVNTFTKHRELNTKKEFIKLTHYFHHYVEELITFW